MGALTDQIGTFCVQTAEYGKFESQQISALGYTFHIPAGTIVPVVQVSALRGLDHHGQSRPLVHEDQGFPPQNPVGLLQSPDASGLYVLKTIR